MKLIIGEHNSKPIGLDLDILLRTRLLIQSNSGGGKSWLIRRICEQAYGKIQTILIDVEGEFSTLREKFPFVLVGPGGEAASDVRSAGLLAEKLLELHASAICDIYELKPYERHKWVKNFLEGLIDVKKTLWHPCLVIVDEAHYLCMDSDTEILTSHGWKKWNQISIGDMVIAFNPITEKYNNEPIQKIIKYDYKGEMCHFKSDGIDSFVTPDHRVIYKSIQRAKNRYGKIYGPYVRSANKVPTNIQILIGGGPENKGIPDLSLEMCHLLGWIITDGHYTGGGEKRGYLGIEQSVNTIKAGIKTVEILDSLNKLFKFKGRYQRAARINQRINGRCLKSSIAIAYYLGKSLSLKINKWLINGIHRIPRQILEEGSKEQLESLLLGLLEGDGTCGKKNWGWNGWRTFFPGNNENLADDFQELCTRLGISTSKIWDCPVTGQGYIHISNRKWHFIRHKPKKVQYKGIVWDITIPSGAFIARRNGKVFVTGNCPEKGAGESEASEAMIRLATQGRKRGFTAIFATQRLGKIRKDAAAELTNVFVGRTWMDIDRKRAADMIGIRHESQQDFYEKIRMLKPGQFYVLGPAISTETVLINVGDIKTTHPEAGKLKVSKVPTPEEVKKYLPKLEDLPKQAEAKIKTIDELKKEITFLKIQLSKTQREQKTIEKTIEVPVKVPDYSPAIEALQKFSDEFLVTIKKTLSNIKDQTKNWEVSLTKTPFIKKQKNDPWVKYEVPIKSPVVLDKEINLRAGAQRMLAALVQWFPNGMTIGQMRSHAGMKKSGTFSTYMSDLRRFELIREESDFIYATDKGVAYFGNSAPSMPSTTEEVLAVWTPKLRAGAKRILNEVVSYKGEWESLDVIAEKAEMKRSGTFSTYLSDLRTARLVETQDGKIRANRETLFL